MHSKRSKLSVGTRIAVFGLLVATLIASSQSRHATPLTSPLSTGTTTNAATSSGKMMGLSRAGVAMTRRQMPMMSLSCISSNINNFNRANRPNNPTQLPRLRLFAKGFGSSEDDKKAKSVRIMTTSELKSEISEYGLDHEDCEDRADLEKKLTAIRRGTYKEGKLKKVADDAGGYLRRSKSPDVKVVSSKQSHSQESAASSFDTQMQTSNNAARNFDTTINERLKEMDKKGQKVFDLLSYPCEHEIRIVGAKESSIDDKVRMIVGDITGADPSELKTSHREKGKWVSVAVLAPVSSSEMLYDCYSKLQSEKSFRYVI